MTSKLEYGEGKILTPNEVVCNCNKFCKH